MACIRPFYILLLLLQSLAFLGIGLSLASSQRIDESAFDRKETRGNSTFGCSSSGPCTPCTYTEKSDDKKYHCSTSGYRQSYRCVEVQPSGLNRDTSNESGTNNEQGQTGGSSSKKMAERVLGEGTRHSYMQEASRKESRGLKESSNSEEHHGMEGRKVFEAEDVTEDGLRVFHVFYSCSPTDVDEILTVLGFEGIVLGFLAISAPLIYYRRRRSFSTSGMTRMPTNARF